MVYAAEKWEASQIHVIFFKQSVGGMHMLILSDSTSTLVSEQLWVWLYIWKTPMTIKANIYWAFASRANASNMYSYTRIS